MGTIIGVLKITDSQLLLMKRMHADRDNSIQEICDMLKISRTTLFRLLRKVKFKNLTRNELIEMEAIM